jgi:hypothetical protein
MISKRWLIKGIIARGETSAWIAPPGGSKSALLAEAAICCGGGLDWRGKRNKAGPTGVIYFALERADLVKRRLLAHRQRMNLGSLPIAVVSSIINLMTPSSVPTLIETIRRVQDHFDLPTGLLIFDTFAKLIAAGGGDEDKAKDQGAVFANIQRLKERTDAHIALIGHTGKDESRGPRGSNAILGDADIMVRISGDAVRTAVIEKANDLPEGPVFAFRSEIHEFGTDDDGEPISVSIVSREFCEVQAAKFGGAKGKIPKAAQTALRALAEAINEQGAIPEASAHIPNNVRTITLTAWRQQAYRRGISASDEQRARQQAFKRASEQLIGDGRVGVWDQHVWLTS